MRNSSSDKPPRLASLDALRGLAIATMILVNNPGSWSAVYPPLLHAKWHGFTPTDLVFPGFLFVMGVAMAFSLPNSVQSPPSQVEAVALGLPNSPQPAIGWRIVRRCLLLFALGLLLNGFYKYDWSTIRVMGVLQRISLTYLLTCLLVLKCSPRMQAIGAGIILVGYQVALQWVPVPGFGAGNLSAEGNFGAFIDRWVLGTQHLLKGGQFDPEGLFSTLPAVVTVWLGYRVGVWLQRQRVETATSVSLAMAGLCGLVLGQLWGVVFPINKALWTSSYVVYSFGWCCVLLALFYQAIDVKGWKKWGFPLRVMGMNAIFLFVGSGLVARVLLYTHVGSGKDAPNTYTWIYEQGFKPWAGAMNGSLLFAIATVLIWWVILYMMYRRGWFLKV
jgi:predicted acyltransferase